MLACHVVNVKNSSHSFYNANYFLRLIVPTINKIFRFIVLILIMYQNSVSINI